METLKTPAKSSAALDWAHPIVREWFLNRLGAPTEPQEQGWPHILQRTATLISAPIGSGKTLAAFLACIDGLVRKALSGGLERRTEVLYVSPLKALSNDIKVNLEIPLGEIQRLAMERGLMMPEIRTAVRTGDTLMPERRAMLERPPHILVTTPESLYILLTAQKSREILKSVNTVIVDEIHAVADDKRGAHLALSLERLEALTERPPLRIGLSATQKPIEQIARFLAGGHPDPQLVQIGHQRQVDLAVEVPASELGPVATHETWEEIYHRIADLVRQHRSTLVFVNTRRLAERVAHHLAERLGDPAVATHHGSLSRKLRLAAEKKLKAGEIRVLVATASLELGIDVGAVDLVCQVGSTRSISVAWQRIGRAGHWHGAIPKGRIFASTRDELVESAALVRAMRSGDLDSIEIRESPMDILAQQIVAACACDDWTEDGLFALVRRAYPYRNLERSQFDSIVEMLSEGISARRGRYGAYLLRDRVNRRLHGRRGSRLVAITSGGAIPDNSLYSVVAEPEGTLVGTVDEDFAVESLAGDVMLLGNSSWRIRRVTATGRVLVEDAHGATPTIPFWRGEAPARTAELSSEVAELREKVSELTCEITPGVDLRSSPQALAAVEWLKSECALDRAGAEQIVEHIVRGRAVLGAVPTQKTIIAERFFDESGGMQLVVHAPFGGRINKAWGLALRKRFCRSFNLELQAAATDDGINISLAEQHSFPLADVFRFLHPASVHDVLRQATLASPIFTARWRWDASRALILQRFQGGKKVPPPIQRMRADDLLASVFPDAAACPENLETQPRIPDHPLIHEVMKDALTEAMDVEGLKAVLESLLRGSIETVAVDAPVPSQFSHEILNANPFAYLDDAPLEERRARAVEMRRMLPETVLSEVGKLDAAAIDEVCVDAWPGVRDADELQDVLHTLIALPEIDAGAPSSSSPLRDRVWQSVHGWRAHFEELTRQGRAGLLLADQRKYWVSAERLKSFSRLFPGVQFPVSAANLEAEAPSRDEVLFTLVAGWMEHAGPITARTFAAVLGLPAAEVEQTLLQIERTGAVLRGKFSDVAGLETEWCGRRLLARIHRLTLGRLRREIAPVSAAQFMRWLFRWQHVARGTQLAGDRGTLEALRQLQGYEAPANAWEHQILARRVMAYDPKNLDHLCLSGAVGWGRFSPHPAMQSGLAERGRRVTPSSVAPITFFERENAEWMSYPRREWAEAEHPGLSPAADDVFEFLRQHGASFFAEIVRGTRKLKAEVETALWELVAVGFITADGFDNLRALLDPKRRAGQGSGKTSRPRDSVGRWSLLSAGDSGEQTAEMEAIGWMLLKRYGVVFRELMTRESILPRWREVLIALRRLEDRGEIRGGRFVSGFLGEQFALPMAVESLRAGRSAPADGETITVSAADPLNLAGIIVPGEKVAANSKQYVTFRDGAVVEDENWVPMAHAG